MQLTVGTTLTKRRSSVVTVLGVILAVLPALGGLGAVHPERASAAQAVKGAPQYTWPKIAYDPANTGVTGDPGISTADAGTLGVQWMTGIGAPAVSSPVVAWNATLGETLVYIGSESGYVTAFNQANGAPVWSVNLGSTIAASPLVEGGSVWVVRQYSGMLFKLNATTGAQECSVKMASSADSSLTMGTPGGGSLTIYAASIDYGTNDGPVYAVNAASCAVDWRFTHFTSVSGAWDPLSFGTNANGISVVLFGSADPDQGVYEVNAGTGALIWTYKTPRLKGNNDTDIGSGVTISAPGVNGFKDGVAYVPAEDGYVFAFDLTTGAIIWRYVFGTGLPLEHLSRSTAALAGTDLIFGDSGGVMAVNAINGQREWAFSTNRVESISDPVVTGPAGETVVAVTTLTGALDLLQVSNGNLLYQYQTPGYVVSSFADAEGSLLTAGADGYLYDLAPGGGNGSGPSTAVTSPQDDQTVANPQGPLIITGTASGTAIAAVDVAIEEGGSGGLWWDAQSGQWVDGYWDNTAAVASPGASSTGWTFDLPVPAAGGTYEVFASAVQTNGIADISDLSAEPGASNVSFTVANSPGTPMASIVGSEWVAPGATATASGSGFEAHEIVELTLDGKKVGSGTTDGTGALPPTSITLPAGASFGPADIVATGQTSKLSASVPLYVSNEWAELGYDSTFANAEPHDSTLLNAIAPGPPEFLTKAWELPMAGAVRTSPAVVQDVAYVGDDSGALTAINVRNSEPIWATTMTGAIDSSPAVSGSLVFFGTEAGSVVALHTSDGSSAWSTGIGSEVESAPAVADGSLYVGSDSGTVSELSQVTGSVTWQATVGGAVKGGPSVDPAAGILVVGDGSGAITALSASTGSVLWGVKTGGAITATPSIVKGVVYVGSADGKVYALSESTGESLWTTTVKGAVTASGTILDGQEYVVGTADGDVVYLTLQGGRVVKTAVETGAIVGIASTTGWVTVTTAGGAIDGLKRIGDTVWQTSSGGSFSSAPVIVNGVVYTTNDDAAVVAYTVPGVPIP